ncbi:MAG: class I SAM-dependent methyltransferase [Alphaproteobacteria bacterium]
MADAIFEDKRLIEIYDVFDGERHDLVHYLALVKNLKAKSVLDVGCGTGSFSCLLSKEGFDVVGLEPASASLDVARGKNYADNIRWILGDTSALPLLQVDLAVMVGNVAQVFVTDATWEENLRCIKKALKPNGYLVFEVRDPAKKAWENWTRDKTYCRLNIPKVGIVEGWCEVTDVSDGLVSFVWTYVFESDGQILKSHSTLRFRTKDEIQTALVKIGFTIEEIRDAPDRPGLEFVFIARVS